MKLYDKLTHEKFRGTGSGGNKGVYMHPEITFQQLTDKQGLDKATAAHDKLYVHGDTMYVAGTSNFQDVWDDFKIPFGKTAQSQRYKDADALLAKNPQVSNLVGHSLGGAAVLEMQKNHGDKTFKTNTYGAPAVSFTTPDNEDNHRYRNFGDPISIFDRGAESQVKTGALKHYGMAAAKMFMNGRVNAWDLYKGITSAHSYDNFDTNQVSDQSYHHQPTFFKK